MTTTIAVQEETKNMLNSLRDEYDAESFDEVIKRLVMEGKKPKKSHFGIFPGLGTFKREELDRFCK